MKFLENIKAIFENIPLCLSETKNPEDVSINRVMIAVGFLSAIITPVFIMIFHPELLDKMLGYWNSWLTFLGVHVVGNIGKKYFNKDSKGGNENE